MSDVRICSLHGLNGIHVKNVSKSIMSLFCTLMEVFFTYTYGGGEGASISFLLRFTWDKGGGEGVQIACTNAYVIYGRPLYSFHN